MVGLWSRSGRERCRSRSGRPRPAARRTIDGAEDRDAVPAPAYPLGHPADHLRQGGRGHDPQQHRDLVGPDAGRGPRAYDVIPSSIQACMIQAMLSGASSSAPRWSVVVETGKATAWSRGITSRPPAEATAVKPPGARKPRHAEGSRARTLPLCVAGEVAAEVRRAEHRRQR